MPLTISEKRDGVDERRRGDDPHAARVRAAIPVVGRLVVHRRHQGLHLGAVRDDDEGDLLSLEVLLDEHPPARLAELPVHHDRFDDLLGLVRAGADNDSLAGGQPLGLDDQRKEELAGLQDAHRLGRRLGHLEPRRGDPVPVHELLGEDLAPLELGGLLVGAEDAESAALEFVDDAEGQRQLRPDDGQVYAVFGGEAGQPLDIRFLDRDVLPDLLGARVAGGE